MPEDQCVRAMRAIQSIIVNLDTNAWHEGQRDESPLWRALDDIDAIVLGSLQEVLHTDGSPDA